jgi:hypothetical protein
MEATGAVFPVLAVVVLFHAVSMTSRNISLCASQGIRWVLEPSKISLLQHQRDQTSGGYPFPCLGRCLNEHSGCCSLMTDSCRGGRRSGFNPHGCRVMRHANTPEVPSFLYRLLSLFALVALHSRSGSL